MGDPARSVPRPDASKRRIGSIVDPVRNSSDAIALALEERVLSGALAAGDRLPSERDLAVEFGASRPMVREALRSLTERGLIEVEAGRGAFVLGERGPRRFQPMDLEYRRRGTTARQLSETRRMLEAEAAALATEHADADDCRGPREPLWSGWSRAPTPLDRVRNDLAFHTALVAASHNPVIETMFASIQVLTVENMVRSAGDPEIVRQSEPYHRLAYEAIRARDPIAARAAIEAHLERRRIGPTAMTTIEALDTTAERALRLIGSGDGLDEFLRDRASRMTPAT